MEVPPISNVIIFAIPARDAAYEAPSTPPAGPESTVRTGSRVAELPIGKHVDAAAFDPSTSLVFSSNGDSADVTVVTEDSGGHFAVKGSLATANGAKTMALDAATHRIYVPAMGASGFEILVAAPK